MPEYGQKSVSVCFFTTVNYVDPAVPLFLVMIGSCPGTVSADNAPEKRYPCITGQPSGRSRRDISVIYYRWNRRHRRDVFGIKTDKCCEE